jgi:hypothetical protein
MMVGMMVMLAVVVMSRAEAHDVTLVSHVKGSLYPTAQLMSSKLIDSVKKLLL